MKPNKLYPNPPANKPTVPFTPPASEPTITTSADLAKLRYDGKAALASEPPLQTSAPPPPSRIDILFDALQDLEKRIVAMEDSVKQTASPQAMVVSAELRQAEAFILLSNGRRIAISHISNYQETNDAIVFCRGDEVLGRIDIGVARVDEKKTLLQKLDALFGVKAL